MTISEPKNLISLWGIAFPHSKFAIPDADFQLAGGQLLSDRHGATEGRGREERFGSLFSRSVFILKSVVKNLTNRWKRTTDDTETTDERPFKSSANPVGRLRFESLFSRSVFILKSVVKNLTNRWKRTTDDTETTDERPFKSSANPVGRLRFESLFSRSVFILKSVVKNLTNRWKRTTDDTETTDERPFKSSAIPQEDYDMDPCFLIRVHLWFDSSAYRLQPLRLCAFARDLIDSSG